MIKVNNYIVLALVVLISGTILPDHLWGDRAFAQDVLQQVTAPGWSRTGSLNTGRMDYTATLLANGKVLVAGGINCAFDYLNSAELYDPATGTWSYTGSLNVPRREHSAILLLNGKVLVSGGEWGTDQFIADAELYDPTTGTWSPTSALPTARIHHTATLLGNGKVLAVGGAVPTASAELYDPATGKWSTTGSLTKMQSGYRATLLADGKVLFLETSFDNNNSASAELYNPNTETWSAIAGLNTIHDPQTITRLPNDKVLVTGGGAHNDLSRYAEIYDPASGTWSSTDASGSGGILLPNGKVLAAGETWSTLYDPVTGRWTITTGSNIPFYSFLAILLSSGQVLFPNGLSVASVGSVCAPHNTSAALFDYRLAPSGTVSTVSAASYRTTGLASESIAVAFGNGLATTTSAAVALPLPTDLAGTTIQVTDSSGMEQLAPLFFVSPTQINYQIPPGTAEGLATVTIRSGDSTVSDGLAFIQTVAPGLFTANASGEGVAAALAIRVKADGSQSYEPVAQFDTAQNRFVARPLDLGPQGEQVYLALFGTGIRRHSSPVRARIWPRDGIAATGLEVTFAGAHGGFTGLDQVNVRLPRVLIGRGEVELSVVVDGWSSNQVRINIQ